MSSISRAHQTVKEDAFNAQVDAELHAWREELCPGFHVQMAEIDAKAAALDAQRNALMAAVAPTFKLTSEPYIRIYMREHPEVSRAQAVWDVHFAMMGRDDAARRHLGPRPENP